MTPGDVAQELMALHWSSHGLGATEPEILAGLALRGIEATHTDVLRCLALHETAWRLHPDGLERGGHAVIVPDERRMETT